MRLGDMALPKPVRRRPLRPKLRTAQGLLLTAGGSTGELARERVKALGGGWNLDRGAGVGSLHESSGTRDCALRTGGLEANGEASASGMYSAPPRTETGATGWVPAEALKMVEWRCRPRAGTQSAWRSRSGQPGSERW